MGQICSLLRIYCSIAWYNQLIFRRQVYTATSYSINYIEHSNDALGDPSISVISEGLSLFGMGTGYFWREKRVSHYP